MFTSTPVVALWPPLHQKVLLGETWDTSCSVKCKTNIRGGGIRVEQFWDCSVAFGKCFRKYVTDNYVTASGSE